MTVIYVDILFLINSVIDYLLLLSAARIAGEPLCRGRFVLGAFLGGIYAVGVFWPGFLFLRKPIYKVLSAVLMLLVAYGAGKRFLRQSLIFFLLTSAFGGAVIAIGLFGGQGLTLGHGVIYSTMDRKIVFLSAAVCYVMVNVGLERVGKHIGKPGELWTIKICLFEKTLDLPALLDTGNTLTDPITGHGVVVVESSALKPLFPTQLRRILEDMTDPAAAMTQLQDESWKNRFRLLPYRSVGVSNGLLLAIRSDWLEVNGMRKTGALLAISPTVLSDGGGYRAMIGRDGVW